MAKKGAAKKVAKKSAKNSGKKKAAKARRQRVGKSRRVPLHRVSKAARARVMRDFKRVLAEHDIAGDVAEVHFDVAGTPAAAGACPPGTVRRLICFRNAAGTLVCEERCVPL